MNIWDQWKQGGTKEDREDGGGGRGCADVIRHPAVRSLSDAELPIDWKTTAVGGRTANRSRAGLASRCCFLHPISPFPSGMTGTAAAHHWFLLRGETSALPVWKDLLARWANIKQRSSDCRYQLVLPSDLISLPSSLSCNHGFLHLCLPLSSLLLSPSPTPASFLKMVSSMHLLHCYLWSVIIFCGENHCFSLNIKHKHTTLWQTGGSISAWRTGFWNGARFILCYRPEQKHDQRVCSKLLPLIYLTSFLFFRWHPIYFKFIKNIECF